MKTLLTALSRFICLLSLMETQVWAADVVAQRDDPCHGLEVVHSATLLCTHGGDPVDEVDVPDPVEKVDVPTSSLQPAAPAPPAPCPDGGVSGKRVEVIYAVPQDRPNNYAASLASVRAAVDDADSFLDESSSGVAGQHYRWLCENGSDVTVRNVTLIPVGGDASFTYGDMVTSLENQVGLGLGPTDFVSPDRAYLVFVDQIAGVYPFGGQGNIFNDDSPDPAANLHQVGPHYSLINGFSGAIAVHELGHNFGAVQLSAPQSSGAWHCFEEEDEMCYSDGGPYFVGGGALVFNCPTLPSTHFDCGQDDYYNLEPGAGTYLALNWNVSNSAFLTPAEVDPCAGAPPAGAIVGTHGPNALVGTSGNDTIFGLGGDDDINGRGGNDLVCGGDGKDRINSGAGDDNADGGAGNDEINGGEGNDTLKGGIGDDAINGGPGNDSLDGDAGFDRLNGGPDIDACVNGELVAGCP